LTNETQQVVWAADYQPFGEATLTKDNVTFNLRFPGQYFDSEIGLHYNYYRDYDPALGRYIQSDPIGLAGGLNPYNYVGASPLRWRDTFGLRPIVDSYASPGAAAAAATNDVNATSIAVDREFAGRLYQNPDGSYSYTPANIGESHSSDPGPMPLGFPYAGRWHTHGDESPGYDDENFSPPG